MEIVILTEATEKRAVCEQILSQLPDWFGVPESNQKYVDTCGDCDFFVAKIDNNPIGFVAVKTHFPHTAELYVLGILNEYHRKGIGRALFDIIKHWAKEQNLWVLQVKTLSGTHPDPYYQRTRLFYESMGFFPLEELDLWGPENPCLLMLCLL